jgi:phosphonate transport system substrate-binding protein
MASGGHRLPAADADRTLVPATLRAGYTARAFLGVNPSDARASFNALSRTVGQERGYDVDVQVTVFDTLSDLERAIRDGQMQVLTLTAWELLELDYADFLEPVFISVEGGQPTEEFLLLTRPGDAASLEALNGRAIALLETTSVYHARIWVEDLLESRRLAPPESFFSQVEVIFKPSQAVLPVFFGKTAACVVDRSSFETIAEMNPQMKWSLVVAATSEPFARQVICISRAEWNPQPFKADFIQALRTLHESPAGRQLLTLFKVDGLLPFHETHLASLRRLRARRPPAEGIGDASTPTSRTLP